MGPDYVRSMCHDIEDPTFDATAVASNPRAQVRPIHRPPRVPTTGGRPAPALRLDGDHRRVPPGGRADPGAGRGRGDARARRAARSTRSTRADDGPADYAGPAASPTWTSRRSRTPRWCGSPTRSASRCTCSTCASCCAVRARATATEQAHEIATKQLVGIAGVAAERIHRALGTDAARHASSCTRCSTPRRTSRRTSPADARGHAVSPRTTTAHAGRTRAPLEGSTPVDPGPTRGAAGLRGRGLPRAGATPPEADEVGGHRVSTAARSSSTAAVDPDTPV